MRLKNLSTKSCALIATVIVAVSAGAAYAEAPVWGDDGKLKPLSDGFPNMPIRVWNVQPPGHADEAEARILAKAVGEFSPVPVVVESAAAGPLIHYAWMDRLPTLPGGTDGYHTAVGSLNGIVQRMFTFDLEYSPDQLKGATLFIGGFSGNMLVTRPDLGFETIDDLVAWAKEHPGELRIATCTIGCGLHITTEDFASSAGIEYRPIPNKGTAQAVLTMLGGGAEAATAGPAYVLPLVEEGKVRPLLTWAPGRLGDFPDVPTGTEAGYSAGVARSVGLLTHPDVSDDHKEWLHQLFKKAYETDTYRNFNKARGYEALEMDGADKDAFLQELFDILGPVTVDLGLATERNTAQWKKDHPAN